MTNIPLEKGKDTFGMVFDEATQRPKEAESRAKEIISKIVINLSSVFSSVEADRREKEEEWLKALRQFRGEYDRETLKRLNERGGCKIYPKLTRSKVISALSRVYDIIFPDTGKNWSISPTPEPEIPNELLNQAIMALAQTKQQITMDDIKKIKREIATQRCLAMERVMADQLVDMNYSDILRKVIFSGFIYGTGVAKGILAQTSKKKVWRLSKDGKYEPFYEKRKLPFAEFVPIWNFYPDTSVADLQDCEFVFQRHSMKRQDLRALANRPDFLGDTIKTFLSNHPKGYTQPRVWEQELKDVGKRMNIEVTTGKYDVIEFWGYIPGNTLEGLDFGKDTEAIYESDVMVNIWFVGKDAIKFVVFYGDQVPETLPFHVFYFEKDETSIFGSGIPKIMEDSQEAVCAASRMLINNGAVVCEPQFEVNTDLLRREQNLDEIHGGKIWYRFGRGVDAQYPAIRPLVVNSYIPELTSIIKYFKENADEETTFPTHYLSNEQHGIYETAKGLSMRNALLNMTIKEVVKRFDEFQVSFLKALYDWNMHYNEDESIKGDYSVVPLGTQSLVAKEVILQELNMFMQTLTPEERMRIREDALLKQRLRLFSFPADDLVLSEEEYQAKVEASQDKELTILAKEKMAADIAYQKAKALHMVAKSKKATDKDVESETLDKLDKRADIIRKELELLEKGVSGGGLETSEGS